MIFFEYSKFLNYLYSSSMAVKNACVNLWSSFYVKIYLIFVLILNFLCWIFVYAMDKEAGNSLILLHYNVNFGADLIGAAEKIYIIPFFGSVIIFLNLFMVNIFYGKDKFLGHLILAVLTAAQIFLLLSLTMIYLINFR